MEYNADIIDYFDVMKDSVLQKHVLIHGCNCMGKFNSGLAKQIRNKYPQVYESYMEHVKNTDSRYILGDISCVPIGETGTIINAFTQRFYGTDPNRVYVDYRAIGKVLHTVAKQFPDHALLLPKIGAGLGNGDWKEILCIINQAFENRFFMIFNYSK